MMSNTPLTSFGKFSTHAKSVLLAAQRYAEATHSTLGSEHLLVALTITPDSAAYALLRKIPITPDQLRLVLSLKDTTPTSQTRGMLGEAKAVLERAAFQATVLGTSTIETEFILWSLVSDADCTAFRLVTELGVEPKSIRKSLERIFLEESAYRAGPGDIEILGVIGADLPPPKQSLPVLPPDIHPDAPHTHDNEPEHTHDHDGEEAEEPSQTPMLDEFTIDFTAIAAEGGFDPVIGRAPELERLTHILGRKTKNNPLLLGEPGVGKTAIVEGLAQRIVAKQVPEYLQGTRILSLELSSLIAGTMYRGQFEDRLRKLVAEFLAADDTILFLDEIHTVVGAGNAEGSLDAANILKPALAKGALRVIGATTAAEYQKYIEKDAALERRLQPIFVAEPSATETRAILAGLAPSYATFHGVTVSDAILDDVVALADRYIHDRHFPDKAIDLLDEAAASRKAKRGPAASTKKPSRFELERQAKELRSEKEYEIGKGNFERAAYLRNVESSIKLSAGRLAKERASATTKLLVLTSDDIRFVVSRWTGIPANKLTASDRRSLLELEDRLKARVIGQDGSITQIAAAIRRARSGIERGKRPMGAFLLVGPTGVGKTETARAVAEEVYGDAEALIKLDMSEYMERHQVARLLGAPPGYIGHDNASPVLETIRRRPHQVILLDEIEKAHPDVFHILLQMLEDGIVTDSKGRTIHFGHSIILLTSNIGGELWKQGGVGFQTSAAAPWWQSPLQEQLRAHFRPELLNRLDGVLTFQPLTRAQLVTILRTHLDRLSEQLGKRGIQLVIDDTTMQTLAARIEKVDEGARAVRRIIDQEIATQVADATLRWPNTTQFVVVVEDGKCLVRRAVATAKRVTHGSRRTPSRA